MHISTHAAPYKAPTGASFIPKYSPKNWDLLHRVADRLRTLGRILAESTSTCLHINTSWPDVRLQRCCDCGRVRHFDGQFVGGFWRKEVR